MSTTTHPRTPLERLGAAIADEGVARHEAALAALARTALAAGVDPVLCAVLADRTAPEVVRCRAFGRVALALAAPVAPTVTLCRAA